MDICLFNPGIEDNQGHPSSNLGDLFIERAVLREIKALMGDCRIFPISSHVFPGQPEIKRLRQCPLRIVGGTNLLSSNMNEWRQWKISVLDAARIRNAILFGVGWWQYQEAPNALTRLLLRLSLSRRALHSVRDGYTEAKLRSVGFKNVINTCCPTMWPLAQMNSEAIPRQKADTALLMLTDYYSRPELDTRLAELVLQRYAKVYFWPQGRKDMELIAQFGSRLTPLQTNVASFDEFINSGIQFDYIGTRLHGGVICLLAGKRSLIVEVDNRAREIARDTGLPTAARDDFEFMARWITGPTETHIALPLDAIARWRAQFRPANDPGLGGGQA
jgi:hypothetical protein